LVAGNESLAAAYASLDIWRAETGKVDIFFAEAGAWLELRIEEFYQYQNSGSRCH
jgi:hypothetical protein